jgi:hypothetical protein
LTYVDDEPVDEEDQKKVSVSQALKFTDCVDCDINVITTALLSGEDICNAASANKDMR